MSHRLSARQRAARTTAAFAAVVASAALGAGTTTAAPAAVSGDLRVVSNWTGAEGDAFQAVIDAFHEANPDVTVTIEQVPFDQTQALLTQQFTAGDPPDVSVALPGIIRLFAEQGLLMDLTAEWDAWIASGDYTESLRSIAAGPDGTAYGVYFKGNVNGLIWYSPPQLEELGIAVPTTWDEFTAAMDAAAAADVAPLAVGGADGWPLTQWSDPIILASPAPRPSTPSPTVRSAGTTQDRRGVHRVRRDRWQLLPRRRAGDRFIDATCARANGDALFQNQGAFINLITPAECDESLVPGDDFTFFPMPSYTGDEPVPQAVSGDLFVGAAETGNEACHARPAVVPRVRRGTADLGGARRLHRPQRQRPRRRVSRRQRPSRRRIVADATRRPRRATTSTTGSAARSSRATSMRSSNSSATVTSTPSSPR